jgi:hypothetical protein
VNNNHQISHPRVIIVARYEKKCTDMNMIIGTVEKKCTDMNMHTDTVEKKCTGMNTIIGTVEKKCTGNFFLNRYTLKQMYR